MCGICGVCGAVPGPDVEDLVRRMCAQLIHRGPDDEGVYIAGRVGLGMRRLSIIDLTSGSQPMFNEDGSVAVVFNGEIYNFEELRTRLLARGHRLLTRSDTEVISHLYEDYGERFVEHLNGMFAIALWDEKEKRLVLARDRLGVKPLHYAELGEMLVFGSEIKSLLECGQVDRSLDVQALYHFFALGYIPQPRSIYRGVKKLPPGCLLVADGRGRRIQRYWDLPAEADAPATPETIEQLRSLVADAVRLRMISDVPLGAFLSGGLDSSVVVSQMAKASPRPVRTFFIDFDNAAYSERRYARAVADRFGTEHHELSVRPSAIDVLDDLVHFFDEPFGDSSAIPTYYVSKLAREFVTVALSGDGGDENFGGYRRYGEMLRRRERPVLRQMLRPLARGLERCLPRTAPGRQFLRSLGMSNREYYVAGSLAEDALEILSPECRKLVERPLAEELESLRPGAWKSRDPLLPYTHFDLQWYLPDDILAKVDRMSMAHSLEVRGPFLDYRVVELAARLPAEWKIAGQTSKWILKQAFRAELPAETLEPRKRGFSLPMAEWLRHELRPFLLETLHDPELAQSGLLSMTEFGGLVREHLSGARNRKSQLWRILFFARWWQCHCRNRTMTAHRVKIAS